MDLPKVVINRFLKETHSATEIKEALFHAAEAAQAEGWTFMETSFQLGGKAKDEGLGAEDVEAIIRRAFSSEKRSVERESAAPAQPAQQSQVQQAMPQQMMSQPINAAPAMQMPAGAVMIDPRFAMMGLDTQSIELLQNHRIDPEALSIPWPTADWRKDLAKLLDALFEPDETISFKMSNTPDASQEKVSTITTQSDAIRKIMKSLDGPEGALIAVNAVAGSEGAADEAWRYRYVVVDSPKMMLAKQLAYYKALNLPCAALVNTGANSVQAWVKILAADAEEFKERVEFLFKTLDEQGFKVDNSLKRADAMVRMPGVLRSGKQQYLIGLEQGAKDFAEWQEWVEYSLDGKPLIENASDCVEPPKAEEPILEDTLRAGELMLLTAPPKAGKSFALLDLALSVSNGGTWFGAKAKEHDVLYINFELTRSAFLNRLHLLAKHLGVNPATEHLGFLNLRGTTMSPLEMGQYIAKRVQGAKKLENHNYKLIIIDPVTSILHSPKVTRTNGTPNQMLMQMLDSIISLTGSAVITTANNGELPYLEERADSLLTLEPVEGIPNSYQLNGSFRDFPKPFTRDCTWMYPQFVF